MTTKEFIKKLRSIERMWFTHNPDGDLKILGVINGRGFAIQYLEDDNEEPNKFTRSKISEVRGAGALAFICKPSQYNQVVQCLESIK